MENSVYSKLITDNIYKSYSINSKKRRRCLNEYIKKHYYWDNSKPIRFSAFSICLIIGVATFCFTLEEVETAEDFILVIIATLVMFLLSFIVIYGMCLAMIRIKCSDGMIKFKNIHVLFGTNTLYVIKENFSKGIFDGAVNIVEKISYIEEIKYDEIRGLIYDTKLKRLDIVGNYKTTRIRQRLRGVTYDRIYGVKEKHSIENILMVFDSNSEIFELLNKKCKCRVSIF